MTATTATMTPAEFRCAREFLGLEIKWIAAALGVTVRQVNRWERGVTPIPTRASDWLHAALADARSCVDCLVAENAPLVTYADAEVTVGDEDYPASWHRMVCARVADATGLPIAFE